MLCQNNWLRKIWLYFNTVFTGFAHFYYPPVRHWSIVIPFKNIINEENPLYPHCICNKETNKSTPPSVVFPRLFYPFQFPSNNSSPGLALTHMKNDLKAHTERDNPSGAQCSPASTIEEDSLWPGAVSTSPAPLLRLYSQGAIIRFPFSFSHFAFFSHSPLPPFFLYLSLQALALSVWNSMDLCR